MKKGGRGGTRFSIATIHRLKVVLQGLEIFPARGKGPQERWIKFTVRREKQQEEGILVREFSLIHRVFAWTIRKKRIRFFAIRSVRFHGRFSREIFTQKHAG